MTAGRSTSRPVLVLAACAALGLAVAQAGSSLPAPQGAVLRIPSADGVEIAYSSSGSGRTALVFIHGGLADRSFWAPQVAALSRAYQVVTLDLAGHGDSGRKRSEWSLAAWGRDVRAVVDALGLKRTVLIGNSLGGAVALEAAHLLPGRVLGVVGVDTLHDATEVVTPEQAHAQAEAFRNDFDGACRAMVARLFHPGSRPELQAWAEKKMCAAPPEVVVGMMNGWGGYDLHGAFVRAGVPIRAINGDLWPTLVEHNRTVVPDFDAVIMKGCGHYPMLERPEEFNRLLVETVQGLERRSDEPSAS